MIALWDFVWNNWSWLGALTAGPFAFVARQAGRRSLMWLLLVAAVLLAVHASVTGVQDYIAGERAEAAEAKGIERDAYWRGQIADAERAALKTIRDKEAAAYQRGIDDAAKRQAMADAEIAKAETIIREIEHASPGAAACRFDSAAAAALNRLRRGEP